jgi:hypothetical protein
MRKLLITIIIVLVAISTRAQLSMTLQVPPSGILLKDQLWTMLLGNTGSSATVALSMTLTDANTGDQIMNATTEPFALNHGTLQIQGSDLSIAYSYSSPLVVDHDAHGFLPLGNFQACYNIALYGHIGNTPEECINIVVEPISPPLLNLPADGSTTENAYPQFNWLPPSPLEMFSYLTYDLILVEVQNGQLPTEAIQQNMPVFMSNYNENIFSNYPSSYAALDTSKLYAWQVVAKNSGQFAAQSEIWTFKVKADSTANHIIDKDAYIKLQRTLNASVSTVKGILKFHYDNISDDSLITYKITSTDENDLGMAVKEGNLAIGFGENYLTISLEGDNRLVKDKYYLLEITNSRNERFAIKFIYKLPEESTEEDESNQ